MVLVKPEPCFQPVTMTTESPALMKPFFLPTCRPNWTRTSTSFSQSPSAGSV